MSPCDGASGMVGRHSCYLLAYNIGASSHLIPRPDLVLDTSWGCLFIKKDLKWLSLWCSICEQSVIWQMSTRLFYSCHALSNISSFTMGPPLWSKAGIGSHVLNEVSQVWRCRGNKYIPLPLCLHLQSILNDQGRTRLAYLLRNMSLEKQARKRTFQE